MASLTLTVSEQFKSLLKAFHWVNWSELGREEALQKLIFENYMKTGTLTDTEWEFCERMNWHPVDELPLKEEFRRELEKRKQGPFLRFKSVDELFKMRK